MPSVQDGRSIEGFGIVFLEAAKFGVPSIGGIQGGASDNTEWKIRIIMRWISTK